MEDIGINSNGSDINVIDEHLHDDDFPEEEQNSPQWMKSPDEKAEFADWKIDVKLFEKNILPADDKPFQDNPFQLTITPKASTVTDEDIFSYSVHLLILGL